MKIRSKLVSQWSNHSIAFDLMLLKLFGQASRKARLFEMREEAASLLSIRVTWFAPRDRASIDNTPLPAKRSRQSAPLISCINQLKSVSLIRAPVGRMSSCSGKVILRPRQLPLIMRSVRS